MPAHPSEKGTKGSAQFMRERARLLELLNTDAAAAIREARALAHVDNNWKLLRAVILCDAAIQAKDASAAEESVAIFSELHRVASDDGGLTYNLANALSRKAQLDEPKGADWYLRTAALRRTARLLYGESAKALQAKDARLASQVMTNLGTSLDAAHRWMEALEAYQAALALYPDNGIASGCAAEVVFRIARLEMFGHQLHLLDFAARLAHHAKAHRDVVLDFGGPAAAATFDKLESRPGNVTTPLPDNITDFERFVAENRLLLSPVLDGVAHDPKRWDDAHLMGLTESVGAGASVPPLYAMFNTMKADYLVARELLFHGLSEPAPSPRDTGLYMDTLDYAVYGVAPSRLVLAQRAGLDLLDKIAVALNEHFAIGIKVRDCHFHTFWREKLNAPTWRPALATAIANGNPALVALSEIGADLTDGSQDGSAPGLLSLEKQTRQAGTHRFVVLHDLKIGDSRPSSAIEHYDLDEFRQTALRTVRLARAALLHFLEVVEYVERARPDDGKLVGEMLVYPHHHIRGEE
jgi:tetratricopeptide (TPR) repeat protein